MSSSGSNGMSEPEDSLSRFSDVVVLLFRLGSLVRTTTGSFVSLEE